MAPGSREPLVYDGAVGRLAGSLVAVVHCWMVVEHRDCRTVQMGTLRSLARIVGRVDWLLATDWVHLSEHGSCLQAEQLDRRQSVVLESAQSAVLQEVEA